MRTRRGRARPSRPYGSRRGTRARKSSSPYPVVPTASIASVTPAVSPAVLQADKTLLGDVERSAVIRRVERIDKLTRLIDRGELGRRAPRIDTERHTHRLSGRIRIRTLCRRLFAMACHKIRLLGRCGKKRAGQDVPPRLRTRPSRAYPAGQKRREGRSVGTMRTCRSATGRHRARP